jgi:hypothetical protein
MGIVEYYKKKMNKKKEDDVGGGRISCSGKSVEFVKN